MISLCLRQKDGDGVGVRVGVFHLVFLTVKYSLIVEGWNLCPPVRQLERGPQEILCEAYIQV